MLWLPCNAAFSASQISSSSHPVTGPSRGPVGHPERVAVEAGQQPLVRIEAVRVREGRCGQGRADRPVRRSRGRAAAALAAANKRIANILRKATGDLSGVVEIGQFREPAERQLFDHVLSMERAVNPLFSRREYTSALSQLATLREDVDRFFDSVMVMADDPDVRANRLGLLVRLRGLFLQVAESARSCSGADMPKRPLAQ